MWNILYLLSKNRTIRLLSAIVLTTMTCYCWKSRLMGGTVLEPLACRGQVPIVRQDLFALDATNITTHYMYKKLHCTDKVLVTESLSAIVIAAAFAITASFKWRIFLTNPAEVLQTWLPCRIYKFEWKFQCFATLWKENIFFIHWYLGGQKCTCAALQILSMVVE